MSWTLSLFVWLVIAVLAAIAEILIPAFGFIVVAVAAVVAGVGAAAGAGVALQVLLFVIGLMGGLFLLRPRVLARLRLHSAPLPSRTSGLVGKQGQVTQEVNPTTGTGRVLVGGEDWAARCGRALDVGSVVRVVGADGIVLLVEPVDRPH